MQKMIGYYAHHQGSGHLARASSICAHLRSPVTVLTSAPVAHRSTFEVLDLPRDDNADTFRNPTAGGTLHWAPLHDNGFQTRMHTIAPWIAAAQPSVMVVDVSVEVAMLARLLGIPTVVVAMPGDRVDPPHELVYAAAEHILAAWPGDLYDPPWLHRHAAKTTYVGGVSRFATRGRPARRTDHRITVLVLAGAGGTTIDMDTVRGWAATYPQYRWDALGVAGAPWVEDPWPAICDADVVITAAGQNAVADIAAAGTPAIVIAEERPHGEQRAMAEIIDHSGLGVGLQGWPQVHQWPALIDRARLCDPEGWQRWATRGAAARAADVIERVASEHAPSVL